MSCTASSENGERLQCKITQGNVDSITIQVKRLGSDVLNIDDRVKAIDSRPKRLKTIANRPVSAGNLLNRLVLIIYFIETFFTNHMRNTSVSFHSIAKRWAQKSVGTVDRIVFVGKMFLFQQKSTPQISKTIFFY